MLLFRSLKSLYDLITRGGVSDGGPVGKGQIPRKSNRMRVINYQPSYPTDSQSQSERTQKDIQCAPAHMLPGRTLCPTYDPS